jgi:hypothetical protein
MKSMQSILGQAQRQNKTNGLPCGDYVYRTPDPREAMWKLDATMTKEEVLQFIAETDALLARIK